MKRYARIMAMVVCFRELMWRATMIWVECQRLFAQEK
jgi:hypothetical protein